MSVRADKGKKTRKYGRDKLKCQAYRARRVRERNKLRRILRSNGVEFARAWALERHCIDLLPT